MFLSLEKYLSSARNALLKHGYGNLCKDEDAISYVAEFMMRADQVFNETGNRDAFRMYYANFGIKNYLRKLCSTKHKNKSLNFQIKDGVEFGDTIQSNATTDNIVEYHEIIEFVKQTTSLTPQQKKCFLMRYVDNQKMHDIAEQLNITKQAVSLHIKNATKIIREKIHV